MAYKAKFGPGGDPSWYPLVLAILARDYPKINDQVWNTAITENAQLLAEKKRAAQEAADTKEEL